MAYDAVSVLDEDTYGAGLLALDARRRLGTPQRTAPIRPQRRAV
jgi:hypothetical protein